MSKILVTGGLGYIGSHTCVELLGAGFEVAIVDNLCNSKRSVLDRLCLISGKQASFHDLDVRDREGMDALFAKHQFASVIHFAGLKAVGESVAQPLWYYDNNVHGSLVLLDIMAQHGVRQILFSSSATVYGEPASVPIREDFPLHATNPYGRSKLMVEEVLRDLAKSENGWKIALLRYFNPVGAHESGLIGEDPNDIPNNLLPYIAQVAIGKRAELAVYGDDYPTPDGTGVRDYIHVVDLAKGHLAALEKLQIEEGIFTVNLGTGKGHSVLEMLHAFEHASSRRIPYIIAPRRSGDIAQCFTDSSLAKTLLGWSAQRSVEQMCVDTWHWQKWAAKHLE